METYINLKPESFFSGQVKYLRFSLKFMGLVPLRVPHTATGMASFS